MTTRIYIMALVTLLSLNACIETTNTYDKLPPGIWRGSLILDNKSFTPQDGEEEIQRGTKDLDDSEIPFNFEIGYTEKGDLTATIINGEERIEVSSIEYGRNNMIAKDTFRLNFPEYDSYIRASYEDNGLEGRFVITSKNNYYIPFRANYGQHYRFTNLKKKPKADLSGLWEVTFDEGTEDAYKAAGEFQQDGNRLTGTFRTETGDYRFLEGTVQDNKAYLSVFDGTHAFVFTMKILDNDNLIGTFRSGKHYKSSWVANRNPSFKLTDPAKLTYISDTKEAFNFSFPDSDGNIMTVNDPKLEGKVKVFSIMGTWCPNCKDEMNFLKEIQKNYKGDVEVVALAFERYKDQTKAFEAIKRYSDKMELNFPMLHGGPANKTVASETFPMLNKIISFPTLVMMDKNNEVQYIHTGFNGPATSKYKEFVKEFNDKLKELI